MKPVTPRLLTALVSVALLSAPWPALADETIRCDSHNFGYRYCRVDTDNRVELLRRHSGANCNRDRSWGYDRHGVWVDHGCSADFRVRRGGRDGDKALAVGAAIVGIGLIAAMASAKSQPAQKDTAAWAIGSFSAYDESERAQVELTILPDGSLSGRAGTNEFSGRLQDARMEAGRHAFRIERSGNGFAAVDERNASHRLQFQRTGGGY